MNITFLIGNGFDLRLGMKTRFIDMYEGYIAQPSLSDAIYSFKKILKADAPRYKTWADFEMAMANKAKEFASELDFIECLRDFKVYMVAHLREEQKQFNRRLLASSKSMSSCMNELSQSIQTFHVGLTPNVVNMFVDMGIIQNPHYRFISFNYTDTFDNLLASQYKIANEVIHIHGKLDADIVLGVDNLNQVTNLPYATTKRFNRAFIKPEFNKSFDNARRTKAEFTINSSHLICIYGMSLGKSDLSWVVRLKNWLLSDKNHHLVYFFHNETQFSKSNWDAIMDEEENRIAMVLGKLCDSNDQIDKISDQIHIPVGYDIFGIDEILKSEKINAELEKKKREDSLKMISERPRENGILMR